MNGKRVWLAIVVMLFAAGLMSCDLMGDDASEDGSDGGSSSGGGGDAGNGELVYVGETTALTQLVFEDYGEWSTGVYNIDVSIASEDLDFLNGSGSGRFVYLEMFFDNPSVSPGTYTWSTDESAGTFSDFSDVSTVVDGSVSYDELTGGSVTIDVSGPT